jgi:hypothetical protein
MNCASKFQSIEIQNPRRSCFKTIWIWCGERMFDMKGHMGQSMVEVPKRIFLKISSDPLS